jgi:hypothetical protein
MNQIADQYLDICQNIEMSLKMEYERNSNLTDAHCAFALDRAKIAVKQRYGYAANESSHVNAELQGIVDACVAIAAERITPTGSTLKEFLALIDKISRSVRRHSQDGSRAYYFFIKRFLP